MPRHALAAACGVALACACLLGGCATSVIAERSTEGAASEQAAHETAAVVADAVPLELAESGWWAKDSYVHYAVEVRNPNEDAYAEDARVHVVLYDEAGNAVGESEETIAPIGPGETVGFAATCGDGWAPARVEIALVDGSATFRDAAEFEEPFTVERFAEEDKLYYRYEVTGQITNNTDDYVSTVRLSVIMRDESGTIVAGYPGEAYRIKSGQTKDFLLTMNTCPDHASVEVWAQPVD